MPVRGGSEKSGAALPTMVEGNVFEGPRINWNAKSAASAVNISTGRMNHRARDVVSSLILFRFQSDAVIRLVQVHQARVSHVDDQAKSK
jgi:hypothetical protein